MKKGFVEKNERRCLDCGSYSHLSKDCMKRQSKEKMWNRSKYVEPEVKKGFEEKNERKCFACGSYSHLIKDCLKRQSREVSARACVLEEKERPVIEVINQA